MRPVLCFGETIWDLLPDGRALGGAPVNVAYHLVRLGLPARLVSAVGSDALGAEALAAMAAAGLEVSAVRRHERWPTGTAAIELGPGGEPAFAIAEPAAWDEIGDPAIDQPPQALLFGTLALRREANRRTVTRLLDTASGALVVCDLNLRPPHDDLKPLRPLLAQAQLLKLNEHEARRLAAPAVGAPRVLAEAIAQRFGARWVAITSGARGAGLLAGSHWHAVPAPRVETVDTVGAGDAFLAALVAGLLTEPRLGDEAAAGWQAVLRRAAALAAFVASCRGAQPPYEGARFPLEPAAGALPCEETDP